MNLPVFRGCLTFVFLIWLALLPAVAFGASNQSVSALKDFNSSLFPGEMIDLFQGSLKHAVREVSLPGPNGLDINVYREWDAALGFNRSHEDWDNPHETRFMHTFPRVKVLGSRFLASSFGWCEHTPQNCAHGIGFNPGLMLKIPGMEPIVLFHQNKYPFDGSETAYFTNPNSNWRAYLLPQKVEQSNPLAIRVFSPNGLRYDFSKNRVIVRDSIGNTVTYNTGGFHDTFQNKKEYVETHLKSITASDGRKVTFSYSYQLGTHFQVNKMTVDSGTGEQRIWKYQSQHSVMGFTTTYGYCNYIARNAGSGRDISQKRDSCLVRIGRTGDYLGDNSITRVTDPEGRITNITYSGKHITSFTLPDGGKVVYGYSDNRISLRRVLDRDGRELSRISYAYSLTEKNHFIKSSNRVVKAVTATGDNSKTTYHFHTDSLYGSNQYRFGQLKKVVRKSRDGKTLQTHSYTYQAGTSACRHADKSPWQRSECIQTRLKSTTLDGTFKTTYSNFNGFGQPRTITQNGVSLNRRIDIEYFNQAPNSSGTRHGFFGLIASKTITGQGKSFTETTSHYNTKGQPEQQADSGVASVFTYHADGIHDRGNLATVSMMENGSPVTTHLSDYFRGQARSITNALGHTTTTQVNGFGEVTKITDPEGHSVSYEFDKLGRTARQSASNRSPIEFYYGKGFSSQKDTHTGVGTIVRRDGWGRKMSTETGLMLSEDTLNYGSSVIVTDYAYSDDELTMYEGVPRFHGSTSDRSFKEVDALGRIVLKGFEDPAAYKTTYCYEISCLPVTESQVNTGGYLDGSYDYKITGKSKSFIVAVYDRYGANGDLLPVAHIVLNRDKLDEFELSEMTYNSRGQLTSVTKDGIERSFTYDPVYGKTKTVKEPETGLTTYTYNSLGQTWQKYVNGQLLQEFDYDKLGQIFNVSDGTSDLQRFTYYPDGSVWKAWTPEANITFTYDGSNALLTKKVVMPDGHEWDLSITRTPDGLTETVNISPDMELRYSYDEFRRPKAVYRVGGPDAQLEPIAYNELSAVGLIREMGYGNGLRETFHHDDRGRPVSRTLQSLPSGTTHIREEYYIDDENIIAGIHDQIDDVWMLGETDYRGYLVGTSGIWGLRDFTYDASGNLSSVRTESDLKELVYDAKNRFSKVKDGETNVTYDGRGNTTRFNGHIIAYDALERVSAVSGASEINGQAYNREYGYDAFGNRVRIDQNGSLVHLHFGTGNQPFSEIDHTNNTVKTNIYLGSRHVAQNLTGADTALGEAQEEIVYEQAIPCPYGGTYSPGSSIYSPDECLYDVGQLESDEHTFYEQGVCPSGQSAYDGNCYEPVDFECSKYGRVTPQSLQDAIYSPRAPYCGKAIYTVTGNESCPTDLATRRLFSGFGASTIYCYDKSDQYVQCPAGSFRPPGADKRTCLKNGAMGASTIEEMCRYNSWSWYPPEATAQGGQCWLTASNLEPSCPAGYSVTDDKNLATDWQDSDACSRDQSTGTITRYYHQDIFKSVDLVTDETGSVISRKRFSPYGIEERTEGEGTDQSDYGFLGKRVERDAGVSLLGPRAYLPTISRFLSPDPINVDTGGIEFFNRYAYGINNPLKYVDPTGFFAEKSMPDSGDEKGLRGNANGDDKARSTSRSTGSLFGENDDDLENAQQVAALPQILAATAAVAKFGPKAYKAIKGLFKRDKSRENLKNVTNGTRTKKVEPIKDADAEHTTWKTDPKTGEITRHETWKPNPQNPSGWDKVQSTDLKGAPHVNKQTGEAIPTPHTQGKGIPGGVRPADPSEIP